MNEHADADEYVVGLVRRNGAVFDTFGHRHRHAALRRTEHLHRLFGAFDGHLVEHHGARFAGQVRRDYRQQRGKTVFIVHQTVAESGLCSRAARSDQQIDVRNLVAVTHQGLTYHCSIDHWHSSFSFRCCLTGKVLTPA